MRPFRYRFTLANTTRLYESLLAHSVLVNEFASRASVNTELVFDTANVNATVLLRPLGSIVR